MCLLALAAARPDWELHVYLRDPEHQRLLADECSRDTAPLLDVPRFHFAPTPWVNRLLVEEFDLPRRFAPLNLDAYLGLDFTLPTRRLARREAVVLPDLLPFTHPRTVSPRARWLYRRGIRRAVQREARLLCISELTRTELARLFPAAESRASVVQPALSPRLLQLAEAASQRDYAVQVRGTLGSVSAPRQFLLYVGDSGPRKNVGLLTAVYRSMVEQGSYCGSLVLVGGDGRYSTVRRGGLLALQTAGAELPGGGDGPQIYDIGRVPDNDLSQLYSAADLLVNLSVAEGYGYPVLEALAHGTPAVVTKGSAMLEVAPGGIVPTKLDMASAAATLVSALAALPLLRQEVAALPDSWFTIERLGEDLARALES